MSEAHQWSDDQYATLQAAYKQGEHDGYWRQSHRAGIFDNRQWVYYLRGYLAGTKSRDLEPSDEQLAAWMGRIGAEMTEGER